MTLFEKKLVIEGADSGSGRFAVSRTSLYEIPAICIMLRTMRRLRSW